MVEGKSFLDLKKMAKDTLAVPASGSSVESMLNVAGRLAI
jgi:hypothetical protein